MTSNEKITGDPEAELAEFMEALQLPEDHEKMLAEIERDWVLPLSDEMS